MSCVSSSTFAAWKRQRRNDRPVRSRRSRPTVRENASFAPLDLAAQVQHRYGLMHHRHALFCAVVSVVALDAAPARSADPASTVRHSPIGAEMLHALGSGAK